MKNPKKISKNMNTPTKYPAFLGFLSMIVVYTLKLCYIILQLTINT